MWTVAANGREQRTETEAVELELEIYWKTFLRPKFHAVLIGLGLNGKNPSDTKVKVIAKGRNAQNFPWHVSGLDVEWDKVYEKLVSWEDPSRPDMLSLNPRFNFNSVSSSKQKGAKRGGQSRTQQMLEERAECLRNPDISSGLEIYGKFRCSDPCCENKGAHCWCDPEDGSHRILEITDLQGTVPRYEIEGHGDHRL